MHGGIGSSINKVEEIEKISVEKVEFSEALEKNENKNTDSNLLNKLNDLENEYKCALNYFQRNSFLELETDAQEKYETILKLAHLLP